MTTNATVTIFSIQQSDKDIDMYVTSILTGLNLPTLKSHIFILFSNLLLRSNTSKKSRVTRRWQTQDSFSPLQGAATVELFYSFSSLGISDGRARFQVLWHSFPSGLQINRSEEILKVLFPPLTYTYILAIPDVQIIFHNSCKAE